MDNLRNFTSTNRSTIVNVVYIVAFAIAFYYLYKFFKSGSAYTIDMLNESAQANRIDAEFSAMASRNKKFVYPFPIKKDDYPELRINSGGEYTFSMWMYISNWDYRSGLPKSVFRIKDTGISTNYLLIGVLYPSEAKMMIRAHTKTVAQGQANYTSVSKYAELMAGDGTSQMFAPSVDMPQCDVQDIDLQRWVHVAVSLNGRIMDVYLDGKLARSCILPDIPVASERGNQFVELCTDGGFGGYVSGVHFYGYAVTPDRIYAEYQAGPSASTSFLTYLGEKLGIRLTYSGEGGARKTL